MTWLRIGLYLLIAFGVLSFGAVEVWSESILEIGAAALFLGWALATYWNSSGKIYWSALNAPLLGLLGIGVLQLLVRRTAYAFLTRQNLLLLAAYFLIFFLVAQAFRKRGDFVQLAWFVIVFCFAVSLLGIIQHFTSVNEIYWIRNFQVPVRPFGPYVNRNDFAGFVELTLPAGLSLMIFRGANRDLFPLLILLTAVPIGALVLSASRGGIVSMAVGVGILVLLALSRPGSWLARSRRMIALAIAALAILALVDWLGAGAAIQKFSTMDSSEVSVGRRMSMSRGALHIFLDHPILGCGLGTLVDVFPRYETQYDGKVVDHVHDDYAEALAEAGILGGLCGLVFLWRFYSEARKNFVAEQGRFSRALHAGAAAAVCALLLHSFVDFNLHIPANAILFLLQAHIATSPPLPSDSRSPRPRRMHEGGMRSWKAHPIGTRS